MKETLIQQEMPAGLKLLFNRKSVRRFTEERVSQAQLETLARAGMAAPSAGNKQPWAFVAIDDKKILAQLAGVHPYVGFLKKAPAALVVCGDLSKAFEGEEEPFWVQDGAAACQNILLAAEAMGLGAVWTGLYPLRERVDAVQNILNLPEEIIPLSIIPVGHPTRDGEAMDKWKPENLHWQTW